MTGNNARKKLDLEYTQMVLQTNYQTSINIFGKNPRKRVNSANCDQYPLKMIC